VPTDAGDEQPAYDRHNQSRHVFRYMEGTVVVHDVVVPSNREDRKASVRKPAGHVRTERVRERILSVPYRLWTIVHIPGVKPRRRPFLIQSRRDSRMRVGAAKQPVLHVWSILISLGRCGHHMLGWFISSSPIDDHARRWVDEQLDWLGREFADESVVDRPIILPNAEYFPDPYDCSPAAVRRMFDRVCEYMNVPAGAVRLVVMDARPPELVNADGDLLPGAAGLYEEGSDQFIVHLEKAQFDRPMELVGTMAHELSHVRLLGENRIDPERFDNELLTDLTATYLGFGIFLANGPRGDWKSIAGHWPGTLLRRPEYMTGPMFAYALARIAWVRFEQKPAWARHLRWDVRSLVRQALRHLRKTEPQ
jgi:hypothetical protein